MRDCVISKVACLPLQLGSFLPLSLALQLETERQWIPRFVTATLLTLPLESTDASGTWLVELLLNLFMWSVLSCAPWFAVKGSADHTYALGSTRLDWGSEDGEIMNSRPMTKPAFTRNACEVKLEFLLLMCFSLAYKWQVWSDPLGFLYSCDILLRWTLDVWATKRLQMPKTCCVETVVMSSWLSANAWTMLTSRVAKLFLVHCSSPRAELAIRIFYSKNNVIAYWWIVAFVRIMRMNVIAHSQVGTDRLAAMATIIRCLFIRPKSPCNPDNPM